MAEKTKPDEQSSAGAQLATFGGVGAAVALAHKGIDGPLKAIRRAEEMRKSGAGRKEIHSETSKMLEGTPYAGVTYGADKNPRFEIDDSGARLNRAALPSGGKAFAKDVLEHPALYDAYPTAQHITIEKNDKPGSQIKGNSIKLSPRRFAKTPLMGREILTPEAKPLLLHEVQHHIQDREGHAPGGDPSDFDKHPKWGNDPAKKELAYRMLAGEQEANMTIARRNMTAAQRRANMPVPEVPEAHQIVLEQSKGVRSRLDVASLSDAVRSAFDAIRNKDAAEGKAIRYRKVDPSNVNVDADTFQFKSGGDAAGVTDRLRGVKSWDPVAAGKSIMWERADGKLFVGDGHQRTGLAKRLQSEGQTGIRMDAAILRERDGWSAKDVRVFAAMKNIKEGSGTSLDMAKVMRERPDLVNNSLPLSDAKVRDAVSLSKLSPDAFGMVINGVVKPEHAAAVAAVGDSSRHASMLGEMSKAEIASSQHARLYVQQAMAAPQYTETTGSLFGEETQTRSLLSERAKVLDKAVQALKSDKKIFGLLEREAGQIEAAGNKLAHDVNAARAEGAGRTAELVERLAQNRGPVSEMLDRAARAVAEGEGPAKAARSFVREVHDTLKSGGMAGLTGDAPKPATFVDPNQANMFGGGERPGWSDEARAASAEVRAENAKGGKVKKPRKQSMMDSELPPRLGKGRTSAAAAKKWEAEFRDIPQDAAEKRLLARKQGERIGSESKRTKSMTDDMFGGPSTKDKIDAQSRKMAAKGRTGDPMNEGLFGSSKDQTDLVEQSKQQSPLRRLAAKELVDGVRNKKAAGSAPDEVPVAKNGRQLQGNNKATLAADAEANFSRAKTLRAQERKGKKAADMTKIKDELREMFARSPDGKQRNTKGELLPVRRGAEDVALKGGELTAVVNGKRVPVQSWEQLSSALRNTVDATGVGASQTPPVRVVDTSGKVIANVSYNGKIWAGDVGTWKSGDKPIYDPSATAQQGLRSGDMEMLKRTIKSGVGEGLSARHAAMLETATNAQLSELDTFAHEARKGSARTDVDFNRIGAFRQKIRDLARTQSDAAAKAQIEGKGPAGWSDAAREASAKARSVAAPGKAKEPKPRMKDAAVKDLVKKGLVTKEDVKTSASMSDLKAKARSSATQKLIDRGAEPGSKSVYQAVDDMVEKPIEKRLSNSRRAKELRANDYANRFKEATGSRSAANPNVEAVRTLSSKAMKAKRAVVKLGDGRDMPVAAYAEAWKKAKAMPPDAPVRGTPSDPAGGGTAKDVVREMREGMEDRINSKDPRYGKGRKWDDTWQNDARRLKDTLGRKSEVPSGEAHPFELRTKLAEAGRLAEGTPLPPKGGDRSKAKPRAKKATQEPTSGLRGTQNAANLEAIVENRKANATALATAAKSAGVADPHAQMHEMFAPKKDVPHQMTPAGQESRFISRMRAAGSNKTDAELKADFAKAPRKGIAKRTLSLLAPVAIGTAMLAASNEAKAAGMDSKGQSAEAAKAGAVSGAVMVGTTAAQGLAVRSLVRGGLSIARSVPLVQGVMMAGGAVVEGVKAYRDGGSAKDIALAAGKGAWDMSLPGMVVNTARDAKAAIDDRKALEQTPRVAGMQRFNEVAAQYKKRVSESRIVAPVEPSDGDNRPRGWANAKVQAAAQEAKGRKFSGVFKDGSHAQMQQ